MGIQFVLGSEGRRWALSDGLATLGQREMAIPLGWPDGNWRDRQVERLMNFLAGYVESQSRRILPGETMRYGWTTLRFRDTVAEDGIQVVGRLIAQELAEPLRDVEAMYVDGAGKAVALTTLQGYTAIRLGLEETEHPHRSQIAVVCKRIAPEGGSPLFLWRQAVPEEDWTEERRKHDSRWLVGCTDREHAHNDPAEVEPAHLSHLVAGYPHLFPYLALPDETCVIFYEERTEVYKPGDPNVLTDDEPRFRGLEQLG
jgi:hypothetical protein